MMATHIYTAAIQPATHWFDRNGPEPLEFRWPGNRLLLTDCCLQRRPAKNVVVQSYYDGLLAWCATGKGCKDPAVIAKKKSQGFIKRSNGQKARHARLQAQKREAQ